MSLRNESNGLPGSLLHTLTSPTSLQKHGLNTFTVSANVVLTADTEYFVVAEYSGAGEPRWTVASSGADNGSAAGWSVLLNLHQSADGGSWVHSSIGAGAIAIKGTRAAVTPTLTLTPDSIAENGGTSTVTASLDHSSGADTVVTVSPSASDYTLRGNPLTIPAGETTTAATVTITALDDDVDAPDKEVTVSATATNTQGVTGPPDDLTLTIEDDDDAPKATLVLGRDSIGENGGASTVTATLDRPSSEDTTVTVSPSDDYTVIGNPLTIAKGSTTSSSTATITAVDDVVDAPDNQVAVSATATNPQGVTSPDVVTLTIEDDDGTPTVTLILDRDSIGENGEASTVTATLDRPSSEVTTMTVKATPVPPAAAIDYVLSANRDLTIPAGGTDSEGVVTITGIDNAQDESNKEVTVTATAKNAQGIVGPDAVTLTIEDDEGPPTLSIADASANEGDSGSTAMIFVVTLIPPATETTTVDWTTFAETAESGTDYETASGSLTFGVGETRKSVSVSVTGDEADEPDETFLVMLSNASGATLGPQSAATGTIRDDDDGGDAERAGTALVLLFPPASDASGRQGFARIVNHSDRAGVVVVEAIDDAGVTAGITRLPLAANAVTHFNSNDLEEGNADKGIAEGVGVGQGNWRLVLTGALPFTALSYIRTVDGFVTSMHDAVPVAGDVRRVVFFNPASNMNQRSGLRLVNPGDREVEVTVAGTDDAGDAGAAAATVVLPAGAAVALTADELEATLGDGRGKWRLDARSTEAILAMSLLASPSGHLTNLSTAPATTGDGAGAHMVPFFPSASDPLGRQGFVRVANRSAVAGAVVIVAHDDGGFAHETVVLALGAGKTTHFNSNDLEFGNTAKALAGSTGAGEGDWRLELTTELDLEVLAYIRTPDGFLTSMHDVAPTQGDGTLWIAIFNPGSNRNQVSSLRLVNPGDVNASVTITGVDDWGNSPGTAVTLVVTAGASRTLNAAELESGGDGFEGALGDGAGKWRLQVVSDRPILAMSLLASPTGHLTNLSGTPERQARGTVGTDPTTARQPANPDAHNSATLPP